MWLVYLTLLVIFAIFIFPLLVGLLFLNLLTAGFSTLGFSALGGLLITVFIFLGSFINLPLSKGESVEVRDDRFFGAFNRRVSIRSGISINLGGAVIPIFVVSILIPNSPILPTLVTILATALVAYKFSTYRPGIGVALTPAFPVLTALIFSLLLAPQSPETVAFIAGVLGTIIGADLINLPKASKLERGVIVIGGGGVFDGVLLTGIIASLLAGF